MRKQRRPRVSQSVNAGRCWCRKNCFESRCEQIIGGIPGISSLVAKCNERFILKKSASLKVMYDPVDLRISVSNKHQVSWGAGVPDPPDPLPGSNTDFLFYNCECCTHPTTQNIMEPSDPPLTNNDS